LQNCPHASAISSADRPFANSVSASSSFAFCFFLFHHARGRAWQNTYRSLRLVSVAIAPDLVRKLS